MTPELPGYIFYSPALELIRQEYTKSLMKTVIYKGLSSFTFIFLAFVSLSLGQTAINDQYTIARNKVLEEAGRNFREGLQAVRDNRRSDAGQRFDDAVESFLSSTLNAEKDEKLRPCYSQLIEGIYLIEFPAN